MGFLVAMCLVLAGAAGLLLGPLLLERYDTLRRRRRVMDRLGASERLGKAQGSREPSAVLRFFQQVIAHVPEALRPGAGKADEVDRQVPEMIGVVCLGLESGMTFDGAFSLYAERFDTQLALACREAASKMRSGIERRDQALDELSERLGSRPFKRFADAVERSVRFGTGLAPVLRDLADEIRVTNRSDREEQVAKAPTKMLLPTGVLILPAMLILVAGPFVLELLEQF